MSDGRGMYESDSPLPAEYGALDSGPVDPEFEQPRSPRPRRNTAGLRRSRRPAREAGGLGTRPNPEGRSGVVIIDPAGDRAAPVDHAAESDGGVATEEPVEQQAPSSNGNGAEPRPRRVTRRVEPEAALPLGDEYEEYEEPPGRPSKSFQLPRRAPRPPDVEREAQGPPDEELIYEEVPKTRLRRQRVRVIRGTRSRRLVRRIDAWTVFKVSLVFYGILFLVWMLAGVILWNAADAFGLINSIQKSVKTLFDLKTFTLHPWSVFLYSAIGGGALAIMGTLMNVVLAMVYNLISDLVGGLQMVVVTEPD